MRPRLPGCADVAVRALPLTMLLLAGAGAPVQDPASRPPESDAAASDARRNWEELEGRLTQAAAASQPATGTRGDPRRGWLLEFLRRTPRGPRTDGFRLKARFHLAGLCLFEFDLPEAEKQLLGMLEEANPDADIEYHQIAQYGLAQVAELRGDRDKAMSLYSQLVAAGGWYAEFARNGRDRLEARARLKRGEPVLGLPSRADLDGRPHDLSHHDGRPLVLFFWSPASPASRAALERYQRALLSLQGASRVYVVAVSLTAMLPEAERARAEGLKMPILCAGRGWLDPLALQLGVHQVPSVVLLGPRREFIARDLPPKELAEAVRHILDG